jgi:hypothetical protein
MYFLIFIEEEIKMSNLKNTESLEDFMSDTQTTGSISKAITNNLYGLNTSGENRKFLEANKTSKGYVFITRPQLNLTESNLRNDRKLYDLLSTNSKSLHRYVRCLLDPRQSKIFNIHSDMLDENLAFIPMFTNNVSSVSGWSDRVIQTFDSKEGVRKQQYSMPDSHIDINNVVDLDVTVDNVKGNPAILIMGTWLRYMANVYEGTMSKYIDYVVANERDYDVRMYRIITDPSKRRVEMIAAAPVMFPLNDPLGKFFDFNKTNSYNDQVKEFTFRFRSLGVEYNDPILIKEFNEHSAIFNPQVRKLLNGDSGHGLLKVPEDLKEYLEGRCYPIIDEESLEINWWIPKDSKTLKRVYESLGTDDLDMEFELDKE